MAQPLQQRAGAPAAPPPLTALELSYGSALLPAPFKRWAPSGGALNLNPLGSTPVFLWTRSGGDDPPIVDVAIVYDEEPAPAGYKRVTKSLCPGAPAKEGAFLVYRCADDDGAAGLPVVVSVAVVAGEESPGEAARAIQVLGPHSATVARRALYRDASVTQTHPAGGRSYPIPTVRLAVTHRSPARHVCECMYFL